MQKTAIFCVSDIHRCLPEYSDLEQPPKAAFLLGIHSRFYYSTGALERALEEGFRVCVVSRYERLGFEDQWWFVLLKGENVFLRPPLSRGVTTAVTVNDLEYIRLQQELEAWRNLYLFLGEPWPLNIEYPCDALVLLKWLGYKTGRDFVKPTQLSNTIKVAS